MKFIQGKPRNQWEMYCLYAHVDADNEVRLINLFVDSLNLSELGFKVKFKENGRPAYHPGVLLRLFIYGYLNRIRSSRQLEKLKARPFFGHFIRQFKAFWISWLEDGIYGCLFCGRLKCQKMG
jgi:transposase